MYRVYKLKIQMVYGEQGKPLHLLLKNEVTGIHKARFMVRDMFKKKCIIVNRLNKLTI